MALRLFSLLFLVFLLTTNRGAHQLPPVLLHQVLPALLMALGCVLFFRLCRRRGAGEGMAAFLAGCLGLSTLCFCYGRGEYAEALRMLALLGLVERTLAQGERMTAFGMAGAVFWAGVLIVSWRAELSSGPPGDVLSGLYGFTLSSGKSMFLYSPPLLLGLLGLGTSWRRRRSETLFLLAVIGGVMLLCARYGAWQVDAHWGPRCVLPVTPLLLLLALPWLPEALLRGRRRLRQVGVGVLEGVGIFGQMLGASLSFEHHVRILIAVKGKAGTSGRFPEQLGHALYIPQFSPLLLHWFLLRHLLRHDPDLNRDAPWKLLVPQRVNLPSDFARLRIDWWALDFVLR